MLEPKALVRAVKEGNEKVVDDLEEKSDDGNARDFFQFKMESSSLRVSKRSFDMEAESKKLETSLSAPRTTVRSCLARANIEGGKVRVVRGQGKIANGLLEAEAALVAMENQSLVVEEIESLQEGWAAVLSSSSISRHCTFSSLSRAGYRLAPFEQRAYQLPTDLLPMDNDIDVGAAEVLHGVALDTPVWWVEDILLDLLTQISSEGGRWLDRKDCFSLERKVFGEKRNHNSDESPGCPNKAKRVKLEDCVNTKTKDEEVVKLPSDSFEEVVEVKKEQANIFINPFHEGTGVTETNDNHHGAQSARGVTETSGSHQGARGVGSVLQQLRQTDRIDMEVPLNPEKAPAEIKELTRNVAHAKARAALDSLKTCEKNAKQIKPIVEARNKAAAEFRCEVCAISLNSATVLRQHFLGKRHLKAVAAQIPRLEREEKEAAEGIVEVPVEVVEKEHEEEDATVEPSTLPSKEKLLSLLPDSSSTSLVIINRPDSSLIPAQTWPDSRQSAFLEVKKDENPVEEDLRQEVWEESSEEHVRGNADEVICMEEEEIVCIASFKENPTGARPFRGFWPGSKVSTPLAVKQGEPDRKYNFGHCSKPQRMMGFLGTFTGREREVMRGRGRGRHIGSGPGRGRSEPMRKGPVRGGRVGGRGLQPRGIPGRARVAGVARGESGRWWAENVGPNTCSNPSLPSGLASDSPQAKANKSSRGRSTPSPVGTTGTVADEASVPVDTTGSKTTVETIVVDLSSDSELDSAPNSPRSYSSSPSSSWTTTPSPEGQDDMTVAMIFSLRKTDPDCQVHPGLELLRTCSPLSSLWKADLSPLICPEMGSSIREVKIIIETKSHNIKSFSDMRKNEMKKSSGLGQKVKIALPQKLTPEFSDGKYLLSLSFLSPSLR